MFAVCVLLAAVHGAGEAVRRWELHLPRLCFFFAALADGPDPHLAPLTPVGRRRPSAPWRGAPPCPSACGWATSGGRAGDSPNNACRDRQCIRRNPGRSTSGRPSTSPSTAKNSSDTAHQGDLQVLPELRLQEEEPNLLAAIVARQVPQRRFHPPAHKSLVQVDLGHREVAGKAAPRSGPAPRTTASTRAVSS